MPDRTLRDEAARHDIRTTLDETLFVEAGAGTGKTTVLVDRIVNLVRSGADMRRLAAITFTEAAATELRDRIRRALRAAAPAEPALQAAVDELDEAAISTLHAFAQRILLEHPVEAGLPPSFEVLDEIRSALAFDERWAEFLDHLLSDDEHADIVLPAMAVGLPLDGLREMALVFDDHWDRIEHNGIVAGPRPVISTTTVVEPLRRALAERAGCRAGDDRLLLHLHRLEPVVERLEAATDDLEILHLLTAAPKLSHSNGRKGNWSCDIDAIKAACAEAEAARAAMIAAVAEHILTSMLVLVRRFTLDSARARRQAGRLEFHDLLVLARQLVRDSRAVRAALGERFSHLLIDEFQDTDPLQVELAMMLAATDFDEELGWERCTLQPGRLFFVGDAMQSIYRFRRADIQLFSAVGAFIDRPRHLTDNHRSVPGILAWVNQVFAQLVGEGRDGAQPAYQHLVPARRAIAKAPIPVVLLGDGQAQPIASVRQAEARDIAETVLRVRDEQWPVHVDRDTGAHRPAELRDIAILMPTRASLPQLEAALDFEEIPYRVESASLVWGTQGVRDLLSALRAIDDPANSVSVVAALRSPSFACGDDDLLEYAQAGGGWDYRDDPPPSLSPEHPVLVGLRELAALHRDRWWVSVSELVERTARELRCFELAFAHRRPRDHWRRLRWVIDQARAFEEADGGPLRSFVAWADRQADENARVKESALPEADDDAVRILTVHGSKGLQFPVVIVTGLNRPPGASANPAATVVWDGNRPEVKTWGGHRTAGFDAVKAVEGELDQQERLRLLYVALTRAEDHLVISVHHKLKDKSQAMLLAALAATPATDGLWRRLGPPPLRLFQQELTEVPVTPVAAGVERREWSASREDRIAAVADAPVWAATAVAKLEGIEAGGDDAGDDDPPWRRGRAGTAIGRAVHATLQSVDLTTGSGLAAIARAQASAEGVDDAADEIERLAAAALASPSVKEAVGGRHWRELYVAAPLAGTGATVEGFVDLLYEHGDGLTIVDYKTDSVRTDTDITARAGRYRLQGATYALALEATLGRPVTSCVFVFTSAPGGAVEREIADLDAAKQEVVTLLSRP